MKKFACFKHYLANDKKLSALIGHEGKKAPKWHENTTGFAGQLARN